jgi:hypothetical protein
MAEDNPVHPITPETAFATKVLTAKDGPLVRSRQGGLDLEIRLEADTLWVIMRREDQGGLALRMPVFSSDADCRVVKVPNALAAIECKGSLGTARLAVYGEPFGLDRRQR